MAIEFSTTLQNISLYGQDREELEKWLSEHDQINSQNKVSNVSSYESQPNAVETSHQAGSGRVREAYNDHIQNQKFLPVYYFASSEQELSARVDQGYVFQLDTYRSKNQTIMPAYSLSVVEYEIGADNVGQNPVVLSQTTQLFADTDNSWEQLDLKVYSGDWNGDGDSDQVAVVFDGDMILGAYWMTLDSQEVDVVPETQTEKPTYIRRSKPVRWGTI